MPLPATANMQAALMNDDNFLWGDLYTFTNPPIGTHRYSGGTSPLVLPPAAIVDPNSLNAAGGTFNLGPPMTRSKVSRKVGIEPTKVEITIMAGADDFLGGGTLTWQECISLGFFDQCTVEVDRYLAGPGGWYDTSNGAVVWFYGRVGDIDYGRTAIKMQVLSLLATMNQQQMPRRVYASSCTHIFGDAMCLFNRASMEAAFVALAGSTQYVINTNLVPNPINLYVGGDITCISGANIGTTRTIQNQFNGAVYLAAPFNFPISPGDGFTMLPGCDHTINSCQNIFNNLIHYGGMPYIPPPELAI
jgi:uncharacterized phage protein (TIGR02218 family)